MAEPPKKISLLRAAVDALTQGNHAEAIRHCKQALKQDRHNYDAFVILGKALFASNQFDQADMSYRRAVDINASGLRAWQGLAELHEAAGNIMKVVEACDAIIQICKSANDQAHLLEYTRRLAVAFATVADHSKAEETWNSLLEIPSISEVLRLEAQRGIVDAKADIMERRIQEDTSARLSQDEKLDYALVRRAAENERANSEENVEMVKMLWSIVEQQPEIEKYENLLLQLLICQMRAGQERSQPRSQLLTLCLSILSRHVSNVALAALLSMCEEDDVDKVFQESGMPQLVHGRANRIVSLGKRLAHVYPDQGAVSSALAFAMRRSSSCATNLGRTRSYCEHALRVNENSIIGWQVLAELRAAEGAYASASECTRRGLQVVAKFRFLYGLTLQFAELQLQIILGNSLLNSGAYHEARQVFQKIEKAAEGIQGLEASKLLTSALEGTVKVSLAEGQVQDASTTLSSLLIIDPDNAWALAEKGWLSFQNKDVEQAVNLLEQAVTLKPENASYHYKLGLLLWMSSSLLQSREKALGHLLESAKLDPSKPEVFRVLGHYYRDIPGDIKRALSCYKKAVLLDCEDEEAGESLCDLLDKGGQELLEISICQEASKQSPRSFWAVRRLGYIQVSRKEWSDAVNNLQRAARGYPMCSDVWEALGLAYQQLGRLTSALKAYDRAVSVAASCPIYAAQQSGNILMKVGSYEKAVSMFQAALEKAPEHLACQYGLASALLGQAHECRSMGAIGRSALLLKEACLVASFCTLKYANVCSLWKLLGDVEASYARILPWELSHGASNAKCITTSKAIETEKEISETFGKSLKLWNEQRATAAKNAKRAYQKALHLQPWASNIYADLCLSLDLVHSLNKDHEGNLLDQALLMELVACSGLSLEGSNVDLWTCLGALARNKVISQHALIQALYLDGNHAIAWALLGQLYLKDGEQDLAREAFVRARTANPAVALTWAGMSAISMSIGRDGYDEAFAGILYAAQLSPIVNFQLELAKIGTVTHQLNSPQIHVAVEQAVLQAPYQAEVHNFKGLICELKGNYQAAVAAFQLALSALNLSSPLKVYEQRHAVSINLARCLCKVGAAQQAVKEYEMLAQHGDIEDSSAFRGYAVSLWQLGRKKSAISAAKVAVKKAKSSAMTAAILLLWKFTYLYSGPAAASEEIKARSVEFQIETGIAPTAFAIASIAGRSDILSEITSKFNLLSMDKMADLASVVYAIIQIRNGMMDYNHAINLLQKALHMYPQSLTLRTYLSQTLLERMDGKEGDMAAIHCNINMLKFCKSSDRALLCSMLSTAAVACSECGGIKPLSTFSSCRPKCTPGYSTIQELMRWVHLEPWNILSHYYLLLCLMQQAREQRFPVFSCQMLQRLAAIILMKLPASNGVDEKYSYMRLQIMMCASEASLHCGNYESAVEGAKNAACLKLSQDFQVLPCLQLARCHASVGNLSFLKAEYKKMKAYKTCDFSIWLSMVDLELSHRLEDSLSLSRNFDLTSSERIFNNNEVVKAIMEFKNAEMYLQIWDLSSAEKAALKAVMLWPQSKSLNLLHGAICMEIFEIGSGSTYLSSAIGSLSKVISGNGMMPIAGFLLAQAEAGKTHTSGKKWEKYIRAEWSLWPPDYRPAELYFQMGLLARSSQVNASGILELPDTFQSSRSWFKQALHLDPSCIRYLIMLHHTEDNNQANK